MNREIGITFDLWDTVIIDDSDEQVRRQRGLRSKKEERHHVVWKAYSQLQKFSLEQVQQAYDEVNAEFNQVWHEQFITWPVSERIAKISQRLECDLTAPISKKVIAELENMEIEIPPFPMPGVHEALKNISSKYQLGVVSDAIVTPGRNLRKWLELNNLLQYFSAFAFSDEVGHSKPHASMFEAISQQLGISVQNLIHIGDREHNDICGAHKLGMKAILFIGSRSIDAEGTTADAVCSDYSELPEILDKLIQ